MTDLRFNPETGRPCEVVKYDNQFPGGGNLTPDDLQHLVEAVMQTDVMQWAIAKMKEEDSPTPSVPEVELEESSQGTNGEGVLKYPEAPDDERRRTRFQLRGDIERYQKAVQDAANGAERHERMGELQAALAEEQASPETAELADRAMRRALAERIPYEVAREQEEVKAAG